MWLLSSVPMREAYEYLFFMLTVYFGIKMHAEKDLRYYPIVLLLAFCMSLFHKGLVLFMVPLVVILTLLHFDSRGPARIIPGNSRKYRFSLYTLLFVLVVFSVLIIAQYPHLFHETQREVFSGEIFRYIEEYREGKLDYRAAYGLQLSYDNPLLLAGSFFQIVFYYFLYPFPWEVENGKDIYAVMEIAWRLVLIISASVLVCRSKGNYRRIYAMLLILYFINSVMWALGTKNYGTAIRHHLVPYWIIVLLGYAGSCRIAE